MCQHTGTIKTISELLKNVSNISEELTEPQIGDFVSCQTEGCTNKVVYPLLFCTSCKNIKNIAEKIIEGTKND